MLNNSLQHLTCLSQNLRWFKNLVVSKLAVVEKTIKMTKLDMQKIVRNLVNKIVSILDFA